MKEKYIKPTAYVEEFKRVDVITTSGFVPGENETPIVNPFG